jgi:hypothetical protein
MLKKLRRRSPSWSGASPKAIAGEVSLSAVIPIVENQVEEAPEWSEEEWIKELTMAGYFAALPPEIVLHILSYLPLTDWGKGAQVASCTYLIGDLAKEKYEADFDYLGL